MTSCKILLSRSVLLLILSLWVAGAMAQDSVGNATPAFNRKRVATVIAGSTAIYAASMTGLYYTWYKDYPHSSFHFFDDSKEWLQVDKTGHGTTAYYAGYLAYQVFRYSGTGENKAAVYGGMASWLFLATIEVFDGFSKAWGASASDLTANTLGSTLFAGQQLLWHEQRILLKWSFHQTNYPFYRPDLLGKNLMESMIKDYNGQTYWISINPASFMPDDVRFPKWLNFSFGYGAEGMTGAAGNSLTYLGKEIPVFDRYRQFYFGPDIDLTRIKTRSALLNAVFKAAGFLRLPLPAFEFSKKGARFHALYF